MLETKTKSSEYLERCTVELENQGEVYKLYKTELKKTFQKGGKLSTKSLVN